LHQSNARQQRHTEAWIADALAHGEKVFYKDQSTAHRGESVIDELVGVGAAARASGQLEIIDARQCHADTRGEHQALFQLNMALVQRARHEGYPGVAMAVNEAARHVIAPDPEQLLAHERDLDRLTTEPGVRALCCYDLRTEEPGLLAQLAGVHYHGVDDVYWASEEWIGKLVVRGEIDLSNVDRFAAVLQAATADSVRIIDLAGVKFLSVAGSAALARVAEVLRGGGEQLVLVNVPPVVMRLLSVVDFTRRTGAEVFPAQSRFERTADAPAITPQRKSS
jgi:anti-anti-sigma factor